MSIDDRVRGLGIGTALVMATALAVAGSPDSAYAKGAEAQRLYINKSTEHYNIRGKTRAEGERDLHDLVKTGDVEEAWAYVKHKDGRENWYEIGIDENPKTCTMDVDGKRLFKDEHNIESVSLYHFHPQGATEGKRNFVDTETLSYLDIKGYLHAIAWMNARHPSLLAKTEFRTVVESGTYTLKFDRRIIADDRLFKTAIDKALQLNSERGLYTWKNIDLDYGVCNRKNFARENRKFSKRYSNKGFKITFDEDKSPGAEYIARRDTRKINERSRELTRRLKILSRELNSIKKAHSRQRK